MNNPKQDQGPASEGTVESPCSAHSYTLLKRCPDGRVISINMETEAGLRKHLEAMWWYTEGYSVVAVVSVPNTGLEPRGNRVGSEPLLANSDSHTKGQ